MEINNELQEFLTNIDPDNDNSLFEEEDGLFEIMNETDMFESFIESLTVNFEDDSENVNDIVSERITGQNDGVDIDTFLFNETMDESMVFESDDIFDDLSISNIFQTEESL